MARRDRRDSTGSKMHTFEEVLLRLDKHIWYMAHRFGTSIKGQDIEDLHQEGVIKLYEIYSSPKYHGRTSEQLDSIFKGALRNRLRDLYSTEKHTMLAYSDESIDDLADIHVFDAFLDIYLAYHKKHLSSKLSRDAVHLLDLLLEPTPAVYHMFNIQVMRRRALQLQGQNVRIPTKITHQLVGSVLGFESSKTKKLLKELQKVWRKECQQAKGRFKRNGVKS